jgi:hypothetical protein
MSRDVIPAFCQPIGILVHRYTLYYIIMLQDERRLGRFYEVPRPDITLTLSQNDLEYTFVNPHISQPYW